MVPSTKHFNRTEVSLHTPAVINGEPISGTEAMGELFLTGSTKLGEQGTRWQVGDGTSMYAAH